MATICGRVLLLDMGAQVCGGGGGEGGLCVYVRVCGWLGGCVDLWCKSNLQQTYTHVGLCTHKLVLSYYSKISRQLMT